MEGVVIRQGEYARARVLFERILAMQRELGNQRGMAWALFHLAWGHFLSQSDSTIVRSSLTEAEALFSEIGEKWGIADCSWLSGQLALQQGDVGTARTLLEKSLTLFRKLGKRREIAESISLLARVAAMQHDWAAASVLSEESLSVAMEVGDKTVIAPCLEGLAGVVAAGRASIAHALWAAQLWGAQGYSKVVGAKI